jgi:hypothetical protein
MFSKSLRTVLACCLVQGLGCSDTVRAFNNPSSQAPETGADKKARRQTEEEINKRDTLSNGIEVGTPKVYDDSLLQQMLNAAQARLMSLQILDQTGIAARLGSITGATQSISSFGLSVQGSPLPQVATTKNGATDSAVTTNQTVATTSATPSTATTNTTQNTAGAPVTNVVTTAPQVAPPSVSAPAPSTTLPTSLSVSASDILNEQMQLTYEIANLRLLLEGSLNDRLFVSGETRIVKPRVTIGLPITLKPDGRFKNSVAVVEVEVEKADGDSLSNSEPPALVTLLPREKTYNVASITDKSLAISAGVATQVVSVAGSYFHGTKTYYLVKDQDTVALTFQPADSKRVGFLWQFRPVLGAEYVQAGLKQTFVQLSFPSTASAGTFGKVHVRTYWKEYDRKHGLAKSVRRDSLKTYCQDCPIQNFTLQQDPSNFSTASMDDLGNGQLLVTLKGHFLGGTYVRIGSTLLRDGSSAFTSEYQQIRFAAPIVDLATRQIRLVARDGTETPIVFSKAQFDPKCPLKISHYNLTSTDDQNTRLTVELKQVEKIHDLLPLIFVVGPRVFGYGDAPIRRDGNTFSVIVPTALLIANPVITVKALFTNEAYWKDSFIQVPGFAPGAQVPKLSVLQQTADSVKFLLSGTGLDSISVASPAGLKLETLGLPTGSDLRWFALDKDQLKAQKQLVFTNSSGLLFQIPIPSVDLPDPAKSNIKPVGTVTVDADEVIFQGTGLADLQKVVFNGIELKLTKQGDGKVVWVKGLRAAGVTAEAKTQSLDFYMKAGKIAVSITVLASKPS